MAISQTDIDALLSAMARGEKSVRFADGRAVEYRGIDEMRQALSVLRQEVQSVPMMRTTTTSFVRD